MTGSSSSNRGDAWRPISGDETALAAGQEGVGIWRNVRRRVLLEVKAERVEVGQDKNRNPSSRRGGKGNRWRRRYSSQPTIRRDDERMSRTRRNESAACYEKKKVCVKKQCLNIILNVQGHVHAFPVSFQKSVRG